MDSNLAMWSLVVGFFLPPVVAVIQQPKWSSEIRALVTFLVAIVAGAGTAYFTGDLTGKDWVTASLVVLVSGISTYKGLYQPTGIAPKIETATSKKETPDA